MDSADGLEHELENATLSRGQLIRRGAAVGLGLTSAGVLLDASTAGAARTSDQITLNVWKPPHSAQDAQFMNAQFKLYKKTHPNISVDYRVTPWASYDATYTAAFASNNPPDLHYDVPLYFSKYAKAGALVPLDQKFGAAFTAAEKPYDPTAFESKFQGHVYGMPFLGAGTFFVWNKKLFKAAGLDPNSPPTTWTQVMAYAKKLTSNGVSGYGLMDNTTGELVNFYPSILINYGGKFLDSSGKWVLDDAKAAAGLDVLAKMYQAGYMPKFGTYVGHDINTAFFEGKIAMMLTLSNFISPQIEQYKGFDIGISKVPRGPVNGQTLGAFGFWSIATKSKYPQETWDLMQFLCSPKVMAGYCRLTQLFPARKDVHPFPPSSLLGRMAPTQGNFLASPLISVAWNTALDPQAENAITGQTSSQAALKATAQQINQELNK
jgi:ABC-type glycerol-3-phosphate transport system substrate-binding protein